MARDRLLATVALAFLPLAGCAAWPWALREVARPEQTVVSPAGEDGTRYLAVEGGPLASPAGLRSRWNAAARQVCGGEHTRLSEASGSRRQGGITRGRIYEGYIRCLLEPSEQGAGPTVADATAKRPTRSRSANLARTRWMR
jgi:hypothetical protein